MLRKCIHWTKDEWQSIIIAGHRIMQKTPMAWKYLWNKAQNEVITKPRHRPLSSSVITGINKIYHEWLNSGKPGWPVDGKPEPMPDYNPEPIKAIVAEPQIIYIEKEKIIKEPADYSSISTSTLIRVLVERIEGLEKLTETFKVLAAQQQNMEELQKKQNLLSITYPKQPLIKSDVVKKKIRVCIIGLLKDQFTRIVDLANYEIPNINWDLRFLDKDHNNDSIPYVDYVIMTRHISHSDINKIESKVNNDRVFWVPGGQETILQKLRDLASRQ